MHSYIQYFPLEHKYGMMQVVDEINLNDDFFKISKLYSNCIVFIIEEDWRYCNLDEHTSKLINIC